MNMDLETRMSGRSFAGLAGKMMLAGAALLAPGTSFAKDAEPETKGEPDLYAFLFSRSLDQRDLATDCILRKVMKQGTETAAKNTAIEEITILEKLAREHELEIPSSFFMAQRTFARSVNPKDYTWAGVFNPTLWRDEVNVTVDNTLCKLLQTLELKHLAARGVKALDGMVLVPAGSFVKGSGFAEARYFEALTDSSIPAEWKLPHPNNPKEIPYYDKRGYIAESPRRDIQVLRSFWIDVLEVTNGDYAKYCKETNTTKAVVTKDMPKRRGVIGIGYEWDDDMTPGNGRDGKPIKNYPFPFASAVAAQAFASHYGKRLPTEEEWELVARGKGGRLWPWGNLPDYKRGWFVEAHGYGGAPEPKEEHLSPVGRYPSGASPYGALDMAGNISELTSSVYRAALTGNWDDPQDTQAKTQEIPGTATLKGGGGWSFGKNLSENRCARGAPTLVYGGYKLGFRCVMDIPPELQYIERPMMK